MKRLFALAFLFSVCAPACFAGDAPWGAPDKNGIIWRTSAIENGIIWTTPVIEPQKAATEAPPALGRPFGLIAADEGGYHYEALSADAEKMLMPEPLAPSQMAGRRPMIAVVIDDMGVDRRHSEKAVKLPPMVTLSYLPYSDGLAQQVDAARSAGHELILHLPMQPDRKTADPGPDHLGAGMTPLELHARLLRNLDSFAGYAGVNNHMGSQFTQSRDGLAVVMAELKARNLMFLDSRTSPRSLAEKVARDHGILTTRRDVFIDDDARPAAVEKSLAQIESVARRSGTAIAIGHPKDVTLAALEKWIPSLAGKGFDLVPLSQAVALRNTPIAPPATTVAKAETKQDGEAGE